MSYKEFFKQVGITTAVVAVATVTVKVGQDQWDKYQARKSPPPPPPPPSFGGATLPSQGLSSTPTSKPPVGGSLENSPCADQTSAFLTCAFHHSAGDDLLKCAKLAEALKACRKLYKLEPEGGSSWF